MSDRPSSDQIAILIPCFLPIINSLVLFFMNNIKQIPGYVSPNARSIPQLPRFCCCALPLRYSFPSTLCAAICPYLNLVE